MNHALGVVERLSLRHKAQNIMLQMRIIDWICSTLKDFQNLEKYTLEYLTALLMNLALRTEGRKNCEVWKTQLLATLKALLNFDGQQINTYVNGTLYSLFASIPIKLEARVSFLCKRVEDGIWGILGRTIKKS